VSTKTAKQAPAQPEPARSVTLTRRQLVAIVAVVTAVVVAALVTMFVVLSDNKSSAPTSGAHLPGQCAWANAGQPARNSIKNPPTNVQTTGTVTVSLTTSQGPMTFTLNRSEAPCTVASFVSLASQGYFDDTPCHRVTTAGIWGLQCGDPTGSGGGEPGYFIPDEASGSEQYPAGTIAMARTSAPTSGGSQFFIVYKDSPQLMQHLGSLQYAVFGTVSSGLQVVQKVGKAGAVTGTDGRPKLRMQLLTVAVH
jgi:peptidyl-prolyl cis-trans isomerase B (cyclophilin B)